MMCRYFNFSRHCGAIPNCTESLDDPFFVRKGRCVFIVSGCHFSFRKKSNQKELVAAQFSVKGCTVANVVLSEN